MKMEQLNRDFGDIKKLKLNLGGLKGNWFLLEIDCFPNSEHLDGVIFDIREGKDIVVKEGKLCSSSISKGDPIELTKEEKRVALKLKSQKYKIAIFENVLKELIGDYKYQPLVFIIEPRINFLKFPNHPHLNSPYTIGGYNIGVSICYTDKPLELGKKIDGRINETIFETMLWLFKHQFWKKTVKNYSSPNWIDDSEKINRSPIDFIMYCHPQNNCHCGSGKKYSLCCRDKDYSNSIKLLNSSVKSIINAEELKEYYINYPTRKSYELENYLYKNLIRKF